MDEIEEGEGCLGQFLDDFENNSKIGFTVDNMLNGLQEASENNF